MSESLALETLCPDDDFAPLPDLTPFDLWRERLGAEAKLLEQDRRRVSATAVEGYLTFSENDWAAAVMHSGLSRGSADNLIRAIKALPQQLLPEAAKPEGKISAWWAGDLRAHYKGTDKQVFDEDERTLLLMGMATQTVEQADTVIKAARAIGTFAPAEVAQIQQTFDDGGDLRETARRIKATRKDTFDRRLRGQDDTAPVVIRPEVRRFIDTTIAMAAGFNMNKVEIEEFQYLWNVKVLKDD